VIVLPIGSRSIMPDFFIDFCNLTAGHVPPGTATSIHQSGSIVENINLGLASMQPEHEWAMVIGDDHRMSPDLVVKLLEADKDIVVPLCIRRVPPFMFGIFAEETEYYDERLGRSYPGYKPYQMEDIPTDELFPVVASGSAGMMIKRRVLDDVGFPWFESSDGVFLNEDLEFCRKVRAVRSERAPDGYEIWCDPSIRMGHIGQMTVWPHEHEGRMVVKIDHGGPDGMNEVLLGPRMAMAGESAT
jgi:hypothetical protein